MPRALVACLLVLAACGGGGSAAALPTVPEDVDADEAVKEARSVITEVHASIKRGSPQGNLPLVAEQVFVAAPDGQVFTDKTAAVMALTGIYEGKKHKVKSRGLSVVAAPRGHSAWAVDQLEIDGRPYLVTTVLAEIEELWVITAVHVAEPLADKKVKKAMKDGTLPRPPALSPSSSDTGDTATLIDAFTAAASSREAMMEALADRKDVVVVGSAPKSVTRSAKKIRKMWTKALKKSRAGPPTIAVVGEVHAEITPDAQIGWICANVDLGNGKDAPVPHRGFYVFEADPDAGWRLVAAHEAVMRPAPAK